MKKIFMMILLSGMILMPKCVKAQENGGEYGDGNGRDTHRSPAIQPKVHITFGKSCNIAYVCFLSDMDDVKISVCVDDEEIDSILVSSKEDTLIPLYLPIYSTGALAIYVRRGTTLLAYYTTSI